jgi:hypothetical protein
VVSHLVGLASIDGLFSQDCCWTMYTSVAVFLDTVSLQQCTVSHWQDPFGHLRTSEQYVAGRNCGSCSLGTLAARSLPSWRSISTLSVLRYPLLGLLLFYCWELLLVTKRCAGERVHVHVGALFPSHTFAALRGALFGCSLYSLLLSIAPTPLFSP